MIVRFATALRRAGTTTPEFQRHWRTLHAEAVRALPRLGRYVQNHLILRDDGRPWLPRPTFDACAEIEFTDVPAMEAAFSSPAADAVRADSALLVEPGRGGLTICRRRLLREGREDGVKLVSVLRRFPACPQEELEAVLAGEYAEAVGAAGHVVRHEQLLPLPGGTPACDAVDLLWFPDAEAAHAFVFSDAADQGADALAGRALGIERLVAQPVLVN